MTLATDIEPTDAPEPPLPPPAPTPLLLCRHYFKNYVDLFEDLVRRVYMAGDLDSPIHVRPGMTVGEALNVTEQRVAVALADDDGENLLLGLIRTLVEDSDLAPDDAGRAFEFFRDTLISDLLTFAEKADALENGLAGFHDLSENEADQAVGAFRSVGQVISDALAFAFPALSNYRIDLAGDAYLLVDGPYTAVLSEDPDRVLTCLSSEAADDLELRVMVDSFEIAEETTFRLRGAVAGGIDEMLLDTAMGSIGTVRIDGITVTLALDDAPVLPGVDATWAPGHTVLLAEWTKATARLNVDQVSLDVDSNMVTVLVALLTSCPPTVGNLEQEWGEQIRDAINSIGDIAGVAAIINAYVMPVARRIIPICHAFSSVQYGAPFEVAGAVSLQRFAGLKTVYGTRSVGIVNSKPATPGKPTSGDPHDPPDRDDLPDLGGVETWQWPARTAGAPRPQLDLTSAHDRATAVALLAGLRSLSARTKAIAALDVEGFGARTISVLTPGDVDRPHGRVHDRPVSAETLALLERGAAGTEYLFRANGFPGRTCHVRRELQRAMRIVADTPPTDDAEEDPIDQVVVPDLDPGIWTMDHAAESPLSKSRGSGSDPGWVGLSTNCVLATRLYRKLQSQGVLNGAGVAQDDSLGHVAYEIRGCTDVAADFTGGATAGPIAGPGRPGPPAVVMAGLVVAVGDDLKPYVVDLRLLLRPVIYSRGCLPDDAVTAVFDAHDCLETMTGGAFPDATWAQQVAYRDFVFLTADVRAATNIRLFTVVAQAGGEPAGTTVHDQVRAAVRHWFPQLPELPILYNSFRALGGETRDFEVEGGWLSIYRRCPFRDFSGVQLG